MVDAAQTTENAVPSLPDEYIVLLEQVIQSNRTVAAENRAFRELINTRTEALSQRLEQGLRDVTNQQPARELVVVADIEQEQIEWLFLQHAE